MSKKIFKRQEIYWVDLEKTVGTEIYKIRPCLIISNNLQNELSSVKNKEEALSAQIKELSSKKVKKEEKAFTTNNNDSSLWNKVKTPLFYIGGIGIVVMAFVWMRSKIKNK